MLNFMTELLVVLSIFIQFSIMNGILIYKKDSKKNEKIVFYIVLFLIYIIIQISRLFNGGNYFSNINYLFYILAFIAWGGYYNYFYKMGYIKYSIFFYLFSVYYKCLDAVIYRILFFAITGNVISSKESLLVPYLESIKIQIYSNLIIILIYLIFSFFRKSIKLISQDKRNYVYLLFALLVNTMNMLVNYVLKKLERFGSLHSEGYYFDNFVNPKLVGASSIFLILLFKEIIKENRLKSQAELIKNKLDMQYAHYLSIQESHMRVKKLYHDINNHIYCIDNLRNNSKEINEYVNNLKDEIKTFKYIYNTGNMILDIIINEKSEVCLKKGIKFTCSINFSKVNFVKPIDVSSIFSNILDNAIEACDKIVDENINKYIRIKGTITRSFFVLKCENSKLNQLTFNKNILLTNKMDKFVHGIGIQSIKSSLQKYNGELLFENSIDKFNKNHKVIFDYLFKSSYMPV
ncbi:TPA: sensor histidine kinase [Clostridioides difficile]|uniref:Sensor histidine kinase virs n=7 Tax=Clostridioides difficile TaxID=1496 RepID=A0A381I762_CLODI|nr:ATP-binding protein [Clostridioides difficile]AJP10779.1 putative regulatory protein [Clostridioides difficile 630]ARE62002.1 putative regulatory protein [Clostridioides difficile]AXB63882.1 sensor histidine kinase VirS [Clostridioides difficile]EGT3702598.1 GHKL domain-containing protein [Clostridioides difficile]EGT3859419.1 GHKL domain-containing protein [Clostridioides difficile]